MTLFLSTKTIVLAKEAHGFYWHKAICLYHLLSEFFSRQGTDRDRERKLLVVLLLYNNALFISGLTIKIQLNHKPEETM